MRVQVRPCKALADSVCTKRSEALPVKQDFTRATYIEGCGFAG